MSCLDISGASGLSSSEYKKYIEAWKKFEFIQRFDSNVSTQIHNNVKGLQYYSFSNYTEKNLFIKGQAEHVEAYPYYTALFTTVQKNYS